MENSGMVVDTSVFIEFLRAGNKIKTTLYRINEDKQLFISAITLYELLMGATNKTKLEDIKLLTDDIPVLSFSAEAARRAAEIYHQLRKNNQIIEFRDLFIGATCLAYELPLITLNTKHFERIKGIEILTG